MRKLPLLLGALSGGLAGYIFSNKKLREDLKKAKDSKQAAKILGKHLSQDGEKFADDVKQFVESDAVQGSVTKAKKYANEQYRKAQSEIKKIAGKAEKQADKAYKQAKRAASDNGKSTRSS